MLPFKFPERYEFTGERLEGGQGYVYICKDKWLDRTVAVKVMKDIPDAALLRQELAMLRGIRSKHVAEVYDLLTARRSAMVGLVQEYVPGAKIDEWAVHNDDPAQCLTVLHQIACGISDIHQHKKIHRDIKPSNIKFDAEKVVKILDFGLAQAADPKAETVMARGTRFYLAPEFYCPPPIRVTRAVDTFAFGVTAAVVCNKGVLPNELRVVPPVNLRFSFSSTAAQLPSDVVATLDATLREGAKSRPTMSEVKDSLERRLLFGQHRAVAWWQGDKHVLSTRGKVLSLEVGSDRMVIEYDGLVFRVRAVSGNVYVNNRNLEIGALLPGSCVITIGEPALGAGRTFVPLNMSHPGVEP
jgi:serine/threonine-protein kinase